MAFAEDVREIPRLMADAAEQLGKLVRNEAQLAQAELTQKAVQVSLGAGYIIGAALLAVPVLVLLLIALAIWLTQLGLNGALAHLLSAFLGLLASLALAFIGKSYFTPENLTPRVTLRQVEKDVVAAKEMAR